MLNKYLPALQKYTAFLKRYVVLICMVLFGGLYGYLIQTAGQQSVLEPSEAEVNAAYQATNRTKFDASLAEKMRQLESSSVSVKSLFEEARNNPFAE